MLRLLPVTGLLCLVCSLTAQETDNFDLLSEIQLPPLAGGPIGYIYPTSRQGSQLETNAGRLISTFQEKKGFSLTLFYSQNNRTRGELVAVRVGKKNIIRVSSDQHKRHIIVQFSTEQGGSTILLPVQQLRQWQRVTLVIMQGHFYAIANCRIIHHRRLVDRFHLPTDKGQPIASLAGRFRNVFQGAIKEAKFVFVGACISQLTNSCSDKASLSILSRIWRHKMRLSRQCHRCSQQQRQVLREMSDVLKSPSKPFTASECTLSQLWQQYSCVSGGRTYVHGNSWAHGNNLCVTCTCLDGHVSCYEKKCPVLDGCIIIDDSPGLCCPICRDEPTGMESVSSVLKSSTVVGARTSLGQTATLAQVSCKSQCPATASSSSTSS